MNGILPIEQDFVSALASNLLLLKGLGTLYFVLGTLYFVPLKFLVNFTKAPHGKQQKTNLVE